MSQNQVTGKIYRIDQPVQKTQTFTLRNFILDVSETNNGQTYPNFIMLQLVNNNVGMIDQFRPGDVIKVSYNLRGSLFNGQQGETCIVNVNAWKIEPVQVQQGAPQQQQQYAAAPQPQQYAQPQQPPQQSWVPPAAPPAQPQQYAQPQQPPAQQGWTPPPPPQQQQQQNFTPQTNGALPF